ncbi:hypothetical protein YC2023_004723 [Brassica napus]
MGHQWQGLCPLVPTIVSLNPNVATIRPKHHEPSTKASRPFTHTHSHLSSTPQPPRLSPILIQPESSWPRSRTPQLPPTRPHRTQPDYAYGVSGSTVQSNLDYACP